MFSVPWSQWTTVFSYSNHTRLCHVSPHWQKLYFDGKIKLHFSVVLQKSSVSTWEKSKLVDKIKTDYVMTQFLSLSHYFDHSLTENRKINVLILLIDEFMMTLQCHLLTPDKTQALFGIFKRSSPHLVVDLSKVCHPHDNLGLFVELGKMSYK